MKRFEIVFYSKEEAEKKLLQIQTKDKESFIVNGICFNDNYDLANCFIVVYCSNKKIKGV